VTESSGIATRAIVVDHLTKRFGEFTADDDLNFAVEQGEIFGILGPNGAGKSTLIKVLAGAHRPDAGTIKVDGQPVGGPDTTPPFQGSWDSRTATAGSHETRASAFQPRPVAQSKSD
jgi:ABC-type branched-subunit amino acid transport system ATPase component